MLKIVLAEFSLKLTLFFVGVENHYSLHTPLNESCPPSP